MCGNVTKWKKILGTEHETLIGIVNRNDTCKGSAGKDGKMMV